MYTKLEHEHANSLPHDTNGSSEELNLPIMEMVSVIRKSWRIVIILTVAAAVIAVLGGWLKSSYRSEGYFQFGVSFLEFKQLQALFAAPSRWSDFVKTLPSEEQESYARMGSMFIDQGQVANFIEPIYPITKSDIKDSAADYKGKEVPNSISGFRIAISANTPETAQRSVIVIGDFLRDTAILMSYRSSIRSRYTEYLNNQRKYENEVIDIKYKLEQLKEKKGDIQRILHNYPESAKTDTRQIVSLSDVSERFLSPITQLVAIESTISGANQNIQTTLRNQRINAIQLDYVGKVQSLLNKSTSGVAFMKALPTLKDTLNLNMNDEVEKSVYNSLAIENLNEQLKYENVKFIAEPILSNQRSPSLSRAALLGLILGGILGCAYVLTRHFFFRETEPVLYSE